MTALAANKNVPARASEGALTQDFSLSMDASVTIYAGALVVVTAAGYARPGRVSTTDRVVGVAQESKTNGVTAGATSVKVRRGTFKFANSAAGDLIAAKDAGLACYVVDDQTVALTSATNTRIKAGTIVGVDADGGVWVETFVSP